MNTLDLKKIALTEALYGKKSSEGIAPLFDDSRAKYLQVQTSPLKEYVQDVNRFLFSGGISINGYMDLPSNHPSIGWVNRFISKEINPYLTSIWETLAITGEVVAVLKFNQRNKPIIEWFDIREYELEYEGDVLTEVEIKTTVVKNTQKYVYKYKVDAFGYYEYPLVEVREATYFEWDKAVQFVPHGYGFTPVQVLKLNPSIHTKRGKSEFNLSALGLAKTITFLEYGLDENVEFLGNPLIDSPDPKATLKALNKKSQVLQKLPADEGGGHSLLQPQPLTPTELDYLKFKKSEFRRLMGITNTTETQLNDPSGAALRLMNDGLISKAQTKWTEIVESDGLEDLITKFARMASSLGIFSLGSLQTQEDCIYTLQRSQPLFTLNDNEKVSALNVAQMLVDLGVDRIYALKETLYSHLTLEEIQSKLRVNLEDVL